MEVRTVQIKQGSWTGGVASRWSREEEEQEKLVFQAPKEESGPSITEQWTMSNDAVSSR